VESGAPQPTTGFDPSAQSTTIILKGDFFSEKQVRDLLTKVFEVKRKGGLSFE
jgi:hypothetical protein